MSYSTFSIKPDKKAGAAQKCDTTATTKGRSTAERAREQKLRDDPMADVEGPTLVGCRLCGKKIKLSPKSSYDLFHWQTHKGRCLRKAAKGSKLAPRTLQFEQSQPETSTSSATPSLVSDDGTPEAPEPAEQLESQSMDAPNLGPKARMRPQITRPDPDPALEAYLTRTGRSPSNQLPPCDAGDWRKWDWTELRPARWDIPQTQDTHVESKASENPVETNHSCSLRSLQWEHISVTVPLAKENMAPAPIPAMQQPVEVNNSHIWRPITTPDNPPFASSMKASTPFKDNSLVSDASLDRLQ